MGARAGKRKAAVALSGGVDSAAAAALLLREGHDVLGLTMRLPAGNHADVVVEAASSVAGSLGIPLEVVDVGDGFERLVITPFIESYLEALTPNPCVECNRSVKFGLLLEAALERGCDILATGHYVRLENAPGGGRMLLRGVDRAKDQSYVLWTLDQKALERVAFPLGGLTKEEASELARDAGVRGTAPESQDICFLSGASYADLVAERARGMLQPGPILDLDGNELGKHRGLAYYTVGQRRGLNLGGPRAMFVLELRPRDNSLIVGEKDSVACLDFEVEGLSFISGDAPDGAFECQVQTRYRGSALRASVELAGNDRGLVTYPEPGPPAAPGQSAVFYVGDKLLGGGVISRRANRD